MIAMATFASRHPVNEQHIRDRLAYWREHLIEQKTGTGQPIVTLTEVRGQLDYWLDELNALATRDGSGQAA